MNIELPDLPMLEDYSAKLNQISALIKKAEQMLIDKGCCIPVTHKDLKYDLFQNGSKEMMRIIYLDKPLIEHKIMYRIQQFKDIPDLMLKAAQVMKKFLEGDVQNEFKGRDSNN